MAAGDLVWRLSDAPPTSGLSADWLADIQSLCGAYVCGRAREYPTQDGDEGAKGRASRMRARDDPREKTRAKADSIIETVPESLIDISADVVGEALDMEQ